MGIWSHEPFGNDDARDWSLKLEQSTGFELIESTLDTALIVKADEYLGNTVALEAIVAAETIARLKGHFGVRNGYSQSVDEWVARARVVPSLELCRKAYRALDRIVTGPTELLETWCRDKDRDAWVKAIGDLKRRIRSSGLYPSAVDIALDIADELRKYPGHWTQGCIARQVNGHPCGEHNVDAASWSLKGHVFRRYAQYAFGDFGSAIGYPEVSYERWNDAPGRTVADVIALCEHVAGTAL
jgi:hypothetical protein